jgi:hypothetical protein
MDMPILGSKKSKEKSDRCELDNLRKSFHGSGLEIPKPKPK